jgi:hypothetical protein
VLAALMRAFSLSIFFWTSRTVSSVGAMAAAVARGGRVVREVVVVASVLQAARGGVGAQAGRGETSPPAGATKE